MVLSHLGVESAVDGEKQLPCVGGRLSPNWDFWAKLYEGISNALRRSPCLLVVAFDV